MPTPGELTLEAPRRGRPPVHLADLDMAGRRSAMAEMGLPAFRADQASRHYFARLEPDPNTWTDLGPQDRARIAESFMPSLLTPVRELSCDDGATVKVLWQLHDGSRVESVLMGYRDRVTICISSQAGCGMNCPFCATGQAGLTRNLSTAEIVAQVIEGSRMVRYGDFPGARDRVSNVVFMGMGEPLANYRALMGAIHRLVDPVPEGLGMSARGITVSTVGLVPRIRDLADEGLPLRLAVSLHAPDDELRDTLVPINTRYPVSEVLDAAWFYTDRTGRRVSIEYALIKDVNDQRWRAELLAKRLRGHLVHVNLIPLNPTPGSEWTASDPRDERAFVRALEEAGVPVTVRDTRGREIDGACGQLAAAEVEG